MITQITHAGVQHVHGMDPCQRTVLISILDYNTPHTRPDRNKFKDYLELCFKDRCEEDFTEEPHWPDEPDESLAFMYLGDRNERLCSLTDAAKVVDYVSKWHDSAEKIRLVAHCKSGVGRSAAIAMFFGTKYGVPFFGTDPRGRFSPNARVTRMLQKAWENKYNHENQRSSVASV